MRCEEFETRLNDLIDERAQPAADAILCEHASRCPACAKLLREYAMLLAGVTALPCPEVPPGLGLRVVADWRAAPRRAPLRRRTMAMAAALLVAAIPTVAWLLRAPSDQAEVGAQLAAIEHRDAATAGEAHLPLVDQARQTYQPLINATNESLAGVWSSLPGAGAVGEAAPDATALDDTILDEDLTGSLAPVAVSATRSVAALLRVLPGSARALDERGISQ